MKKILNSQSGFTLIELSLYTVITALVLLSVTAVFQMMVAAQVKNQSINEVNQQGMAAMDTITQTIRTATAITSPATGISGSSLTLTVPTAALSPTVIDAPGSTLQIKEGTAAAIPLTNSLVTVSNYTVQNLSKSSSTDYALVRISFTLTRSSASGRNEYSYQKTFTTSAALR